MALKAAKAAPAKKLATAKKPGTKPAKAEKGEAKPKGEKEASFKVGQVVEFGGYKSEQEDPMFETGARVRIVTKEKNEDNQTVYGIIDENDWSEYEKDADGVEGDEVFATELKKAEIVPVDPFAIDIPETERLTEILADADNDVVVAGTKLQDAAAENLFFFGGVLGTAYKGAAFRALGDYDDTVENDKPKYGTGWDRFCQENFGLGGRKADGLIRMYRQFAGIPGLDLKALSSDKKLGWVKLERIATVITADNAQKLLTDARDMNVEEVREMIRTDFVAGGEGGESRTSGPRIKRVTVTARFFEDQAEGVVMVIGKAKDQFGYSTDEQALEHIIMAWANDHLDEKTVAKARKASKNKRKELKGAGVDISERETAAAKLDEAIASGSEGTEGGEGEATE